MKPLDALLLRAALTLLFHSEYIGVIYAPLGGGVLRPLRLAGRGRKRQTVALCLWATHNVVMEARLRDVLLTPETALRLETIAHAQRGRERTLPPCRACRASRTKRRV